MTAWLERPAREKPLAEWIYNCLIEMQYALDDAELLIREQRTDPQHEDLRPIVAELSASIARSVDRLLPLRLAARPKTNSPGQ
jgi:hypothetical protein